MALRKTVLDKQYVFEYDIGQWTFGTLSVLRDRDTGQLKHCRTVPKAYLRSTQNVVPQLQQLQELQHQHIATITEVIEDGSNIYILSEFQQGGDVQDWLERLDETNWLQEQTCIAYVRQVVLALAYSHSAQVYHRDLRPSSLLLTSKLPDAIIKVGDIGLAAILDPDNGYIQKHPTPYTMHELMSSYQPQTSGAVDMWSVGAIAHAMLLGRPPSQEDTQPSSFAWASWSRSRPDDDGWSDRSLLARDFVMRLLKTPDGARATAAKVLNHPWLKGLTPLSGPQWRADNDVARELRHKTLCYLLAVILLPILVPHRDFLQLLKAFEQSDSDRDGYIPRPIALRLLLTRCNLPEAVKPALQIVDVSKNDTFDFAGVAIADMVVREFFAAGPTAAPLIGPFTPTDLATRLVRRLFEVFGDRRNPSPQAQSITAAQVKSRMRTAVAMDMEVHSGVRYDVLLSCLPEDTPLDGQTLTTQLCASGARGTPLGIDEDLSPISEEDPWSSLGVDVSTLFQSCAGMGPRESSPHSVRLF